MILEGKMSVGSNPILGLKCSQIMGPTGDDQVFGWQLAKV